MGFSRQNTGVGCHFLLQRISPTQGLNPDLPHFRWILYRLSQQGSPRILELVVYSFSRGSSWPWNQTWISYIAGRFFTSWDTRETHPFSLESVFIINIKIYSNIQLYNPSIFVHSKMHYPLYLLFRLQVSLQKELPLWQGNHSRWLRNFNEWKAFFSETVALLPDPQNQIIIRKRQKQLSYFPNSFPPLCISSF